MAGREFNVPFYSLHSQGVDICCITTNIQAAIDPLVYCNCQEKEDMTVRIICFPYAMAPYRMCQWSQNWITRGTPSGVVVNTNLATYLTRLAHGVRVDDDSQTRQDS